MNSTPVTSKHAARRMSQRNIAPSTVEAALDWGRLVYCRGAMIYAIGRREIERAAGLGIDLRDLDGVQVVCGRDTTVITVYRNRNFRELRRRKRRH
jgi:hypothetical protein